MKIGGWRTRSVFERYAIVSRNDIADAMLLLQNRIAQVGLFFGWNVSVTNNVTDLWIVHLLAQLTLPHQLFSGAERGTRTPTSRLSPADFKSAASASSAIPAREYSFYSIEAYGH